MVVTQEESLLGLVLRRLILEPLACLLAFFVPFYLAGLPARGAHVIALPMKIGGGSGGPVRVVALVAR